MILNYCDYLHIYENNHSNPGWAQEGPAFQPLKNMLNS